MNKIETLLDLWNTTENIYPFKIVNEFIKTIASEHLKGIGPIIICPAHIILESYANEKDFELISENLVFNKKLNVWFEIEYSVSGKVISDNMSINEPFYPEVTDINIEIKKLIFNCYDNVFNLMEYSEIIKLIKFEFI